MEGAEGEEVKKGDGRDRRDRERERETERAIFH